MPAASHAASPADTTADAPADATTASPVGATAEAQAPALATAGRPARRPAFHRLRIEQVERLCEDAVAVTFAVPDGLAAQFAFRPGQTLTLRKVVDGTDERRSYSICAPPAVRCGSPSGRCPAGCSPAGWCGTRGRARRWRC